MPGDAYINNCPAKSTGADNCPETLGPDWDFGGSSLVLHTRPDGRDILVTGTKGGLAMAFDPDRNGAVLWKTNLGGQIVNGPISYEVDGKQYVATIAGLNLVAFALRD